MKEWQDFFREYLGNPNQGIVEKTKTIQEDHIKSWRMPDGSTINIKLIDKDNIHNNHLQVINQYTPEGGAFIPQYTILVTAHVRPLL